MRAADLGLDGDESPADLEANGPLRERLERIRLQAGPAMGLGDVRDTTVPKLTIVSPARAGGLVTTRTFIPHRVHEAIGVLGAVSVAVGCLAPGTVTAVDAPAAGGQRVEHPTGAFVVNVELVGTGAATSVARSTLVRTARKIMDGQVWPRDRDTAEPAASPASPSHGGTP